jgi:CheY-like chemotaxis protein
MKQNEDIVKIKGLEERLEDIAQNNTSKVCDQGMHVDKITGPDILVVDEALQVAAYTLSRTSIMKYDIHHYEIVEVMVGGRATRVYEHMTDGQVIDDFNPDPGQWYRDHKITSLDVIANEKRVRVVAKANSGKTYEFKVMADGYKGRVLLGDTDSETRSILAARLREKGYEVDEVGNGAACRSLYNPETYDAIIIEPEMLFDVSEPDRDEGAVFGALEDVVTGYPRSYFDQNRFKDKVIVWTGSVNEQDLQASQYRVLTVNKRAVEKVIAALE